MVKLLKKVNNTKFLGVYLDENLNFKYHIDQTLTKFSKITGILYRVRNSLTQEAMISIYFTLCYPHLTYCVSVWGCTWPSFLNRLAVAQNKIFRCIFFLKKIDSTSNLLDELKILKFANIHKYFLLLLLYKCQGQNQLFKLVENPSHTRSHNINLICPIFRTILYKNCIFSFGPKLFNALPLELKVLLKNSNIILFKQKN